MTIRAPRHHTITALLYRVAVKNIQTKRLGRIWLCALRGDKEAPSHKNLFIKR